MRQREELRTVLRKCLDSLSHGTLPPRTQIVPVGILADQECQLKVGKLLEQALVPTRCALRARRSITPVHSGARIAKSHGKNRDPRLVIESRAVQPQPVAQSIPAGVVPGYSALMDLAPYPSGEYRGSGGLS